MLAAVVITMIIINIMVFIIYCCVVKIRVYRIVSLLSLVFGSKLIGGLLCAGYYGVNMKKINI